jgi:hypothetical protein
MGIPRSGVIELAGVWPLTNPFGVKDLDPGNNIGFRGGASGGTGGVKYGCVNMNDLDPTMIVGECWDVAGSMDFCADSTLSGEFLLTVGLLSGSMDSVLVSMGQSKAPL